MEAAISADAVNSKWWSGLGLGLGRRQMGVFGFGSSKESLLLSSIGGGVGCCNWSSRQKNNIMNCTRGLRLESTSMGMGARATIERRQSFNLKSRSFVSAEAASGSGSRGGEDVENGDYILPQESIDVRDYVGHPVCIGLGGVMFGCGYYLCSKITTAFFKDALLTGIINATVLLYAYKEFKCSPDQNRNSGGGDGGGRASMLQHAALVCLITVMAMFGFGYFLRYLDICELLSAPIALFSMWVWNVCSSSKDITGNQNSYVKKRNSQGTKALRMNEETKSGKLSEFESLLLLRISPFAWFAYEIWRLDLDKERDKVWKSFLIYTFI